MNYLDPFGLCKKEGEDFWDNFWDETYQDLERGMEHLNRPMTQEEMMDMVVIASTGGAGTGENILKETVKKIPWQKVTEVVKETMKRQDVKQIIRKFKLDDKTVGVFHEIWKRTKEGWEVVHRDFKGPW